jgi:glutamate dehydrogenase/leucine dehydrogenase
MMKTQILSGCFQKYIADMITGFGVAEAVRHFYSIWWRCKGKKAIVQGFGNVGSAAFY